MHLEFDLDDVKEAGPAPKGKYEVEILNAVAGESRANKPQIVVTLGFTDLSQNYMTFREYLALPFDGDEKAAYKKLRLKRFLYLFDIPFRPGMADLDLTMSMIAQRAFVEVKLNEPSENGFVSNSLELPRLPDEGQGRRR